METLVELMQKQIAQKEEELKLQREEMDKRSEEMQRRSEDMERMHGEERDAAEKRHQEQMKMILEKLGEMKGPGAIQTTTPLQRRIFQLLTPALNCGLTTGPDLLLSHELT